MPRCCGGLAAALPAITGLASCPLQPRSPRFAAVVSGWLCGCQTVGLLISSPGRSPGRRDHQSVGRGCARSQSMTWWLRQSMSWFNQMPIGTFTRGPSVRPTSWPSRPAGVSFGPCTQPVICTGFSHAFAFCVSRQAAQNQTQNPISCSSWRMIWGFQLSNRSTRG